MSSTAYFLVFLNKKLFFLVQKTMHTDVLNSVCLVK